MDGDSIYAMSLGDVSASADLVGTLANRVMCEAIKKAVLSVESQNQIISRKELKA